MTIPVELDFSANNLPAIQKQIEQVLKVIDTKGAKFGFSETEINQMKAQVKSLGQSLEQNFNGFSRKINLSNVRNQLQNAGVDVATLGARLQVMGVEGQSAFQSLNTATQRFQAQVKNTNGLLSRLAQTFMNTVRWNLSTRALNAMTSSISKAVQFTKELDQNLNNIRIVSGQSADQMAKFAIQANKSAQALATTTNEYSQAALIYYQQGLSDDAVKKMTDATIMAANIADTSTQEMSEYLTAIINGYNMTADKVLDVTDKLAAVGAATAADFGELSTGMSKVASVASSTGVSLDSLTAQLATIVSVTREAPESVGTSLKTIYGRMLAFKNDSSGILTDDEGEMFSAPAVEKALQKLSAATGKQISLFQTMADGSTDLRNMEDIINDIGEAWQETDNLALKYGVATALAGSRQQNRLIALMDHWDEYKDTVAIALGSEGTTLEQNETYLESYEAHAAQLQASMEHLYQTLFNSEQMKDVVDFLNGVVKSIDWIVSSLGGLPGIIGQIGGLLANQSGMWARIGQGFMNIRGSTATNILQNTSALQSTYVEPEVLQYQQQVQKMSPYMSQDNLDMMKKALEEHQRTLKTLKAETAEYEAQKKAMEEQDAFINRRLANKQYKKGGFTYGGAAQEIAKMTFGDKDLQNGYAEIDAQVQKMWDDWKQSWHGSMIQATTEAGHSYAEEIKPLVDPIMEKMQTELMQGTLSPQQAEAYTREMVEVIRNAIGGSSEEAAQKLEYLRQKMEATGSTAKIQKSALDQFLNGNLSLTQALSNVRMAITSLIPVFTTLFSVMKDDSKDATDKILSVFGSLVPTLLYNQQLFSKLSGGLAKILSLIPAIKRATTGLGGAIAKAGVEAGAGWAWLTAALIVIPAVVALVDAFTLSEQEATENLEKLNEELQQQQEELKNLQDTAKNSSKELEDLSLKMDMSKPNLGLDESEYSQFVTISEKLIENFSDLNWYYDENGNKVVDMSKGYAGLNEQLETLLKLRQQEAIQDMKDNSSKRWKAATTAYGKERRIIEEGVGGNSDPWYVQFGRAMAGAGIRLGRTVYGVVGDPIESALLGLSGHTGEAIDFNRSKSALWDNSPDYTDEVHTFGQQLENWQYYQEHAGDISEEDYNAALRGTKSYNAEMLRDFGEPEYQIFALESEPYQALDPILKSAVHDSMKSWDWETMEETDPQKYLEETTEFFSKLAPEEVEAIKKAYQEQVDSEGFDAQQFLLEAFFDTTDIETLSEQQKDRLEGLVASFKFAFPSLVDQINNLDSAYQNFKAGTGDFITYLKALNTQLDKSKPVINTTASEYENLAAQYKEITGQDAMSLNGQFGNIDLNNRAAIHWDIKSIDKYARQLNDWSVRNEFGPNSGGTMDQLEEIFNGTVSTVMGAWGSYGEDSEGKGIPIAFSPMLQTQNGATLLTSDTVDNYLSKVIEQAQQEIKENPDLNLTDAIMKINAEGLDITDSSDFRGHVQGLVAAVGDAAPVVSEFMHSIEALKDESNIIVDPMITQMQHVVAGMAYVKKSYQNGEKSLEEYNQSAQVALRTMMKFALAGYDTSEAIEELHDQVGELNWGRFQDDLELSQWQDLNTALADIRTECEKLYEAQKLLADGNRISAESAEQLAQVYPGLLENASVAANGMIQLNDQVVKNFIKGKQNMLTASYQEQIEQIQMRIDQAEAENDIIKAAIEYQKSSKKSTSKLYEAVDKYNTLIHAQEVKNQVDDAETGNKATIEDATTAAQSEADVWASGASARVQVEQEANKKIVEDWNHLVDAANTVSHGEKASLEGLLSSTDIKPPTVSDGSTTTDTEAESQYKKILNDIIWGVGIYRQRSDSWALGLLNKEIDKYDEEIYQQQLDYNNDRIKRWGDQIVLLQAKLKEVELTIDNKGVNPNAKTSGSSSNDKDKPDIKDDVQARIDAINQGVKEAEKAEEAANEALEIAKKIGTADEIAAAEAELERVTSVKQQALIDANAALQNEYNALIAAWDGSDAWLDQFGNVTEAYNNAYNALGSKDEQTKMENHLKKLQDYWKAIEDNQKSLNETNQQYFESAYENYKAMIDAIKQMNELLDKQIKKEEELRKKFAPGSADWKASWDRTQKYISEKIVNERTIQASGQSLLDIARDNPELLIKYDKSAAITQAAAEKVSDTITSSTDRVVDAITGKGSVSGTYAADPFSAYRQTSGPGYRNTGIAGASTNHKGRDLAMAAGTAVRLPIGTTVSETGYNSSRGYYIVVKDSAGYKLIYQHLQSKPTAAVGQYLTAGSILGYSGNTGASSGPHLHEEIWSPNGQLVTGNYWGTQGVAVTIENIPEVSAAIEENTQATVEATRISTSEIETGIEEANEEIENYLVEFNETMSSYFDELNSYYESLDSNYQARIQNVEKYDPSYKFYNGQMYNNDFYRAANAHAEAELLRAQGYVDDSEEILALSTEYWQATNDAWEKFVESQTADTQKMLDEKQELLESAEKEQEDIEAAMNAISKYIENELISPLEEEKENLEDIKDDLENLKSLDDMLVDLNTELYDANDADAEIIRKKIDYLEEQKEIYEGLTDADERRVKMQEIQTQLGQLTLEQLERQLELAKKNLTQRVWHEGIGWVWEADPTAIAEAEKAVNEQKYQLRQDELDRQIDDLDKRIKDYQDYRDKIEDIPDNWQQAQDAAIADRLFPGWRTQSKNMSDKLVDKLTDAYNENADIVKELTDAIEELNKTIEDASTAEKFVDWLNSYWSPNVIPEGNKVSKEVLKNSIQNALGVGNYESANALLQGNKNSDWFWDLFNAGASTAYELGQTDALEQFVNTAVAAKGQTAETEAWRRYLNNSDASKYNKSYWDSLFANLAFGKPFDLTWTDDFGNRHIEHYDGFGRAISSPGSGGGNGYQGEDEVFGALANRIMADALTSIAPYTSSLSAPSIAPYQATGSSIVSTENGSVFQNCTFEITSTADNFSALVEDIEVFSKNR